MAEDLEDRQVEEAAEVVRNLAAAEEEEEPRCYPREVGEEEEEPLSFLQEE